MEQREVTDTNNTTWTCVQAYGGLSSETAEKAAEITESDKNRVTVVCTPTGGEQTVRLELQTGWLENLPDEALLAEIERGRKNR